MAGKSQNGLVFFSLQSMMEEHGKIHKMPPKASKKATQKVKVIEVAILDTADDQEIIHEENNEENIE